MKKQVTLLFLRQNNQLLLAMKKRGFGVGKWNGVGGKVEPGETIRDAAIRECREEIGVTPSNLRLMGRMQFLLADQPNFEHDGFIFDTTTWAGTPRETDEMRPQWFDIADIPYDSMWADDFLWLPHMLNDKQFRARIVIAADDSLAEHHIELVNNVLEDL